MNLFGWELSLAKKDAVSIDVIIRRLEAAFETSSGVSVTPANAMRSPTIHAIVTAVARRISTLPVHVMERSEVDGNVTKKKLPNHPVARLLRRPNEWQTASNYWLDATSSLIRYGNFYAFKARGKTGPIRNLNPLHAGVTDVVQNDDLSLTYTTTLEGGKFVEFRPSQIHHVRGPARNYVKGDSPIMDVRETIALEIAAEAFGATFFSNGAMPGLIFKFMDGFKGFKTDEERRQFVTDFQESYGKRGRFRALLMPNGIEVGDPVGVDNDKAQFLETRKLQRSIIAGAFGVPPHLVGDLERGTFSNIEHQSLEFIQAVVLPYCRAFETAMERDLLTDEDRRSGIIIRFNLDGALRGDFKSRQEGMAIQRLNGVINANTWRKNENMNPISTEDGGDEYWRQGPSGQTASPPAKGGDQ